MTVLAPGATFPDLTIKLPGGSALSVPLDFSGHYGIVLFYRGSWCPFCNAQLLAFQRDLPTLTELGTRVAAVSVDDEATTQVLIDKYRLEFPVGHRADAPMLADQFGAFVHLEPTFVQSTGFVLDPAGRIVVSVYSSGAIGRLMPADVAGLIEYHRRSEASA